MMQLQNELAFSISVEDVQLEAVRIIGRTLTEEEIEVAKNGLESGLLFDIDTVYKTIFLEMLET